MNKIGLIIWREYITRVRKPSFLIMTILGPLLLIGGIFLVVFITLQESGPQEVLVIDESHRLRNVYKTGNKMARTLQDALRSPIPHDSVQENMTLAGLASAHEFRGEGAEQP